MFVRTSAGSLAEYIASSGSKCARAIPRHFPLAPIFQGFPQHCCMQPGTHARTHARTPRQRDLVKYVHRPRSIETRVHAYTHAHAHMCHTRKFSTYTRVPAAAAVTADAAVDDDDEVQPLRELRQFRSLNWRWLDRLVAGQSFPTRKTR